MKKLIVFFLALIFFSACYKDIDLYENNYQSKLGLNSFFYTDSTFRIYVFTSAPPGEFSAANIVKNANVIVYEDGEILDQAVYHPITDSIGYYITTATARNGHHYAVEVSYNDAVIKADDSLPLASNFVINNIELTSKVSYPVNDSLYEVILELFLDMTIDNSSRKGYYLISGYVDSWQVNYPDSLFTPVRSWISFDDGSQDFPLQQNEYSLISLPFGDYSQGLLLDPAFFNDDEINLKLNFFDVFTTSDTSSVNLHILVMNMSRNMYEFFQSYDMYNRSVDNPFVEPVNVRVNVDGGLGIFAGMSIAEDSVKVKL